MKTYAAKVILFGEYTVLIGGRALALPSNAFYAYWAQKPKAWNLPHSFIQYLFRWAEEHNLEFDQDAWKRDMQDGWQLVQNFSQGYGLGSSGTLCAAIYDRYIINKSTSIKKLWVALRSLECYYHGNSSGIDPMVSYLGKPILVHGDKLDLIDHGINLTFQLVDSKQMKETEGLVGDFLRKTQESSSYATAVDTLINIQNGLIESVVLNKSISKKEWLTFGAQHLRVFGHCFTPKMKKEAEEALDQQQYIIKLCGSGGGGYYIKIFLP